MSRHSDSLKFCQLFGAFALPDSSVATAILRPCGRRLSIFVCMLSVRLMGFLFPPGLDHGADTKQTPSGTYAVCAGFVKTVNRFRPRGYGSVRISEEFSLEE